MKKVCVAARILFALAIVASTSACCRESTITIISTNDIHAQIGSIPQLATLVEQERQAKPGKVLLIDAGDRWTGNPYVDRTNQPGKPVIELMDELGYDLATFGNHEFDWGMQVLGERMNEASFDKVVANADFSETMMGPAQPYKFMEIDGLKIAVLGLVTVEPGVGHPVGKDASFYPATFTYPLDEAARYSWLADSSDLYIGLTHIGFEEDSLLALAQPEIDLIIGGHSHTLIPVGRKINQTIVTQTGHNLEYAGITRITHKGNRISSIENSVVKLDTIPADPRLEQLVEEYYNAPELTEPIGTATAPLDKIALMNLFSDGMRRTTGAQFAFHNMGGMRIDHLQEGKITRANIYAAEPFGNRPVVVHMTLEQIKNLLVNKFNSTGKESHTTDLYPSGMTYTFVVGEDGEATDVIINHSQRPVRENIYAVALSDYVMEQYDYKHYGQQKTDIDGAIADVMIDYIERNSPITPDYTNRVNIRR